MSYTWDRLEAGAFRYEGDESKRRSRTSFCNYVKWRCSNLSPRTRWLGVLVAGCLALVLVVTNIDSSTEDTIKTTAAEPDPSLFFYEPETKVVQKGKPNRAYIKPPQCRDFGPSNLTETPQWQTIGKELVKPIKNVAKANLAGGHWSYHFGYGHKTVLSGDGLRLAVAYEGRAGFDRTFGMHVDVFRWNSTDWDLEQTLTDVVRGHSHEREVHYQSLVISSNGERIAFSDGHGAAIFDYDNTADESQQKWVQLGPLMDPVLQQELVEGKQRQFGTNIAMNCDGSVLAVSGENERYSYTKIYQEEDRNLNGAEEVLWAELGEIQGVKFGGSIAMDNRGTRIAIGTVASKSWRGMVQVWEYNAGSWTRLGQPVVGGKPLEKWGGSVALSADGITLVSTAKNGASNRVLAYRFSDNFWTPYGPALHGTENKHERFGAGIALSHDGKILAVGAQGDHELYYAKMAGTKVVTPGEEQFLQGRIYVYQMDGSVEEEDVQWTEIGQIVNGIEGDTFGKSVAISATGRNVAGGSPTRTGKAYQKILGSAHVFQATT